MRNGEVRLDPEEQVIAATLDQAELGDANERSAGPRIEFKRSVRVPCAGTDGAAAARSGTVVRV